MKLKLLVLIAMLMALTVSGCETMEGLGKDLQNLARLPFIFTDNNNNLIIFSYA